MKIHGLTRQNHSFSVCQESHYPGHPDSKPGIVRRRISPDAGRGLEKLGHAIEYLTDEFVRDGCRFTEDHGRVQAIRVLLSLNRQIYFACGVEPTFREKAQSLLRRVLASVRLQN